MDPNTLWIPLGQLFVNFGGRWGQLRDNQLSCSCPVELVVPAPLWGGLAQDVERITGNGDGTRSKWSWDLDAFSLYEYASQLLVLSRKWPLSQPLHLAVVLIYCTPSYLFSRSRDTQHWTRHSRCSFSTHFHRGVVWVPEFSEDLANKVSQVTK